MPISPLLSNIYMRRFAKGWKEGGHERRLDARIVNDADDFAVCRRGTVVKAMTVMRGIMSRPKPTVNETKTRLYRLADETDVRLSGLHPGSELGSADGPILLWGLARHEERFPDCVGN